MSSSHNFICQKCGFKYRNNYKRIDWDGKRKHLIVCKYCWDRVPPGEFPIIPRPEMLPIKNASPPPVEINVFPGQQWQIDESYWDSETDYWDEA